MKTMKEFRMVRNLAAVAVLTMGMAACTQSEEPTTDAGQAPHSQVNIMAGINGAQTRAAGVDAAGTGFNDQTEITILDKNNTSKSVVYKYENSAWAATPALYWDDLTTDAGVSTYSLVGVYPKDASLNYEAGVTADEPLMAFANNQAAKSSEVAFSFKHILSKITVVVQADASFTSFTAPVITLNNIRKSATFKYTDTNGFADFDLTGTAADFVSGTPTVNGTTVTYEFTIPAQTIAKLSFGATGLMTYTYNGSVVLNQGKNTTLTLTLTKTGLTPKSVSVAPWENESASGSLN